MRLRYLQALGKALRDELAADPSVFVVGEDVVESLRGVTVGLAADYPGRILDMPISEQAFTGLATGAALVGKRPVVEYQIPSLLYIAFEQIVNQAQKLHLMTGGQANVPVTYLFPGTGARLGLAGQHSDNPYVFLIHAGIKTVLPATPEDAYGLMVSAIRDDDPVAVFAPAAVLPLRGDVPDQAYTVPLGSGRIHREGDDVTIVAVGHLLQDALAVAEQLAGHVSVEVLDPRTLFPFDWELLARSLAKTRHLVVVDDSNRSCGFGAEVAATAAEEMDLDSPPRRVSRADVTISFAPELELRALPSREHLVGAVHAAIGERAVR